MPPSSPARAADAAQRRCIVSGAVKDKAVLVRFVLGPDLQVVPDVEERLPGRGFWLSADRDTLKKACRKGLFAKAARRPVVVPADLCERVEALLVRRCTHLIGLARRAGEAVFGFQKVRAWLRDGGGGVVFVAADGAAPVRAKMRALATGRDVIDVLRGDELGLTGGRERVVHLIVAEGALADRLRREADRLAGFRPAPGAVDDTQSMTRSERGAL